MGYPKFLLFANREDIDSYCENYSPDCLEGDYNTYVVENDNHWPRTLELLERHGAYAYLSSKEFDKFEEL